MSIECGHDCGHLQTFSMSAHGNNSGSHLSSIVFIINQHFFGVVEGTPHSKLSEDRKKRMTD